MITRRSPGRLGEAPIAAGGDTRSCGGHLELPKARRGARRSGPASPRLMGVAAWVGASVRSPMPIDVGGRVQHSTHRTLHKPLCLEIGGLTAIPQPNHLFFAEISRSTRPFYFRRRLVSAAAGRCSRRRSDVQWATSRSILGSPVDRPASLEQHGVSAARRGSDDCACVPAQHDLASRSSEHQTASESSSAPVPADRHRRHP